MTEIFNWKYIKNDEWDRTRQEIKSIIDDISNDILKCRKVLHTCPDGNEKKGEGYILKENISSVHISEVGKSVRNLCRKEDIRIIGSPHKDRCGMSVHPDGIDKVSKVVSSPKIAWDTGKFTDESNPYIDIVDNMQLNLNDSGFDIKFLLMHPHDYRVIYMMRENCSGTWFDMIKNITTNVSWCRDVIPGTIYAGDIGEDIAQLFITEDFEIYRDGYIAERILPEFYEFHDGKSDAFVKMKVYEPSK